MSKHRNSTVNGITYKGESRVREPLPNGTPNLKKSIQYLREKCEPLRGVDGAIAAYHVLVVLDEIELMCGQAKRAITNPGLKR